jgi:hypothetical protein
MITILLKLLHGRAKRPHGKQIEMLHMRDKLAPGMTGLRQRHGSIRAIRSSKQWLVRHGTVVSGACDVASAPQHRRCASGAAGRCSPFVLTRPKGPLPRSHGRRE